MSSETRLDRLYPALSARERGLLVLRAYKAGEPPDRMIYTSTPNSQSRAFNRLIGLINLINCELTFAILIVAQQVRQIDLKYGWLMSLVLWGSEVDLLGESLLARTKDRKLRADVRKLMKQAPGALAVPLDLTLPAEERDIFKEGFGVGMVRALLIGITSGLRQHWVELRSVEIVVAEVAEEFDGEDALREDARGWLEDAKATCVTISEAIQDYVEPFVLPEPAEDDVALVRKLIEKATEA